MQKEIVTLIISSPNMQLQIATFLPPSMNRVLYYISNREKDRKESNSNLREIKGFRVYKENHNLLYLNCSS